MSTELIDLEFMSSDIRLIIYSLMGDYTAEVESMGIKAIRSIHSYIWKRKFAVFW